MKYPVKHPVNPLFLSLAATFAALALPARASDPELSLTRLDCGRIEVGVLNLFSDTLAYPDQTMTLTNSCYLIRHGDDLMLWDAGMPAALIGAPAGTAAAGPLVPSLAADLPGQLAEIGLRPAQITHLGVSHYHFDHTGQAASFAGAELLIGAADWAVLTTTPLPAAVAGFVMPDTLAPWIAGAAPVRPVQGDHDVFGDGTVMMLAMPGHTPGESVLLVNLPETGPVLLSGDVVHFEEQLALAGVPSFNSNRAGSLAAIDRMQRLVANLGATLVIQHDMRHIARLPAFPAAAR